MLYTGSYRPQTRQERRETVVVGLIFAVTLTILIVGAGIAHFALDHRDQLSRTHVDFPPRDWSTTPPNWID
jgi:hypothetical protein